jgi:restriction system protein
MIYLMFVIAIIVAVFIALKLRPKTISHKYTSFDLKSIGIEQIDMMEDGSEFEIYLYRLLKEIGYNDAYKTIDSGDFGADLVFTDKSGTRTIIQAKRYSNPVGTDAVQQVYTARNYYQAKKAIVITNNFFTEPCETLAGVNAVLLLDRNDLTAIIEHFRNGNYEKARSIIEKEPRIIYEFWDNPDMSIKKDEKAEKLLQSF